MFFLAAEISQETHATPSHPYPQSYPNLPPTTESDIKQESSFDKQPPPNQQPPPQQSYGTIGQHTVSVPTEIIVIGGCPVCRIGVLEDDYTCLGVCLAIFCFPIGILCCLALKNKRCSNCGATF